VASDNATIHSEQVNFWSDQILYEDARHFVQAHPMPEQRQLIGLATFSRTWQELLEFVKHQGERDWGTREDYKTFYRELQRYLNDPQKGLRQRVKTEFQLVPQNLNRHEEREVLDIWAQALAQEFIQHLVAEASLQARLGKE
jgi:hypothetical protein